MDYGWINDTKWHHLHIGKHDFGHNSTMETLQGECEITKVDSEVSQSIRTCLSENISEMFLNSYKSLVRPHLEYATVIWSPMSKKDTIALENVQRRETKLVRSCRELPVLTQRD